MNENYLNHLFKGIELQGKKLLDVGCGDGSLSEYAWYNGADVIGLEPQLPKLVGKYEQARLKWVIKRFQDYQTDNKFDLIVLHDSINHLDERSCIALRYKWAEDNYILIFKKIYSLLDIKGNLLIADASPYNLFADLGIKNPFDKTIEWYKHRTPEYWAYLLGKCGFNYPQISWLTPQKLLFFNKILSNRFMAYCLVSHFKLVMEKNG